MRISRFDRVTSNHVEHIDLNNWEELIMVIGDHRFDYPTKDSVPLISPAEYLPGAKRGIKGVMRVHFGAVDIDGVNDDQLERILERVDGLQFLFYTTWSHHLKPHCGRLFFPLTRPVEAREWGAFWPRLRSFFLNLIDEKASDSSRIFYYPSAPAGTEDYALRYESEGDPLDVDALLDQTVPIQENVEREPLDRREFLDWVRRMRPKSDYGEWLQERLTTLLEGKALANTGDRDNTIFKLVSAIIRRFPKATTDSVAELFVESAQAMGFDHKIVHEKIERAQSLFDQEATATASAAQAEAMSQLARIGRTTPYSSEEVQAFFPDADFGRRWVIQKDKIFYVFCNGEYQGPFTAAEMPVIAPVLLSPASAAGVETRLVTKTGWRPKTGFELAQEYGQIAYHIELNLCAQSSSFANNTLIEAPCPRRALEPVHSERASTWLELLAGTVTPSVLDWLAVSIRLDRPCSAIYLEGAKGAGKTLFAHGVAALWSTDGPVSLEDAFTNFNSTMMGCPIIFADEHMPTDFRGQVKTGQLRQFIQGRSRILRRKFIPDARMLGCIRLILAANHKDMISTSEHLTLHDIEAIVERVLHVPIRGESAKTCEAALYLDALDDPLQPDEIAKHILHLANTRKVDDTHRFLVAGQQTTLHRRLTTGSGLRSAVCHWLCMYLHEPHKIDANCSLSVRKHKGKLLATSRGLTRFWAIYETNVRPPAIGPVSKALAGLSLNKRLLTAGDGRRTWYWELDPENLIAWSEDNNFASRDQFFELLEQEPETSKVLH